jgi:hypothetical protein
VQPSAEHLHWFHMHGIALLAVSMIALYTSAFIENRVHTYWYVTITPRT